MPEIVPDNSLFSIDLNDLQLTPTIISKPVQEDSKSPEAEAFSFNFDDMDFAAETRTELKAAEPEIQFNLDDFQPEASQRESAPNVVRAELGTKQAFTEPSAFIPEIASLDEINAQLKAQPSAAHDEVAPEDNLETKKRAIQDDLDEELLPIFLEEADELYPQLTTELSDWRSKVHLLLPKISAAILHPGHPGLPFF